jgi:hypothetical protein
MDTQASPITPEVWLRLLTALDAGAPPYAACRYAGIRPSVWERERQRIPEFGIAADQVEASGLVAAWRFLQVAAASEWRASLELIKLFGATRGREAVVRPDEQGYDFDAEVSPEDVAAVVRILHAHGIGGLAGAAEGHSNGRHVRAAGNGPGEAVE